MKSKLTTRGKKILSKILPDSERLRYLSWLPKLETYIKSHKEKYPILENRYKMYDYINNMIIIDESIVYLEFGVFEGTSIKYWSKINSNKNSKFYGFDTFTGLPENWENFTGGLTKGDFNTGGRCPQFSDERISFVKGLFKDTLPDFIENFSTDCRLVIHNDADLYSSTSYVLTLMNRFLVPGTIVIFDEFSSVLNEFRALEGVLSASVHELPRKSW